MLRDMECSLWGRLFKTKALRGSIEVSQNIGSFQNWRSLIILLGYSVSVFCIPLFHTIYFPLYERAKLHFKAKHGWPDDSFKLYSVSAGISGLFCNVVTNPFWVVRTRMQAEIFRSAAQEHYERMYKGIFHSIIKIGREEGARALFSGLTASILGISHALIYFPLYEHWKMFFK